MLHHQHLVLQEQPAQELQRLPLEPRLQEPVSVQESLQLVLAQLRESANLSQAPKTHQQSQLILQKLLLH